MANRPLFGVYDRWGYFHGVTSHSWEILALYISRQPPGYGQYQTSWMGEEWTVPELEIRTVEVLDD
jgi:hypothetical protein